MPEIDWSPQQERALSGISEWLSEPTEPHNQVRKLFGYAGTGKSTLAREINNLVGGDALACAYTGKAASVMASKGLPNASTIHRLIYTPMGDGKQKIKELEEELRLIQKVKVKSPKLANRYSAVRRSLDEAKKNSGPQFILKEESEISKSSLVILDECSMINERMAEDLLSFGVRVLVLGDPAQLPPVRGTGYFTQGTPHDLLTEVHRQARGDPIIEIATMVREGKTPARGDYGISKVVDRVTAREALSHDQVLCGTNAKRRSINNRHRELEGYNTPLPQAGERLVCLKNNHDLGLLNGTLWDLVEDASEPDDGGITHLRIMPEGGGQVLGVPAEASIFLDEDDKPSWDSKEQFTFGSCLTVHKSQGSQWDDVLLFDDWKHRDTYRNWLYTGVTRAAKRLTLVR